MSYATDETLLRTRYGALLDLFSRTPPCDDAVFVPARAGSLTARVRTPKGLRFLHSAVDPYAEARDFANSALLHERSIPLIVGFGLGYHLEELYARYEKFERVIVFEPRTDMMKEACAQRDLTPLFSRENLTIITGLDDGQSVARLMQLVGDPAFKDRVTLIVHKPSLNLYEQRYPLFFDALHTTVLDTAALHLMRNNFLANREITTGACGVREFFGAFRGEPAVIAAAGPSLNDGLSALAQFRDRVRLFAVTTALRPLLRNGCIPDLTMLADQQRIMATHFDGIDTASLPLLFVPTASHDALVAHRGEKVVALQRGYGACDEAERLLGKGRLSVGGSVATLALSFALEAGCDPIIFLGQDLAYPDGFSHAQGIDKRAAVSESSLHETLAVGGGTVRTSTAFESFRKWIEQSIREHPDRTFVNVSTLGARIAGTLERDLHSFLEGHAVQTLDRRAVASLLQKKNHGGSV